VLGVSPQAFRSWTPLASASSAANLVESGQGAARQHGPGGTEAAPRRRAVLSGVGRGSHPAAFGGSTALSVTGADAIVNLDQVRAARAGAEFRRLISAPPSASLPTLMSQVRSVIGKSGQVVNLVSYGLATASQRPVATNIPAGAPANYLNLFKASAAKYCPGMSWTVLAAIGQIESGDGANNGPSSAGALGPMQFMPPPGPSGVSTGSARPDLRTS
jgi:hypothetical protein